MPRPSTLVELIGEIYAAAEDTALWPQVLRSLSAQFKTRQCIFVLADKSSPGGQVRAQIGEDTLFYQEYNAHFSSVNVILQRAAPQFSGPGLLVSHDLIHDEELSATEYYEDFLRRWDLFYFFGAAVSRAADCNALISLARSRKAGPFTATEKQCLACLMPHLRRVAKLSGDFARVRQERDGILDRLSMGFVVLDEQFRITYVNCLGERILRQRDGLFTQGKCLAVADATGNTRLKSLLSEAMLTSSGKAMSGGGSLPVHRLKGRPLTLLVSPLIPSPSTLFMGGPGAIIFITDPDVVEQSYPERLAALFGLTPAESKVAGELLHGTTLNRCAENLGITKQTARVHLKRIFSKTSTSKQSELVHLLLRSPVALRTDSVS